jgi:ribosomal protein S7
MVLKKHKYLYTSQLVKKFIRSLSKNGKTQKLETLFFSSLKNLKFLTGLNPLILFLYILNEIKPCLELKTLRLGSVTYQIPTPIVFHKQLFKAIKLLLKSLRLNNQKISIFKKINIEFLLILQKKSSLYKLNSKMYQIASHNRSFSHYR